MVVRPREHRTSPKDRRNRLLNCLLRFVILDAVTAGWHTMSRAVQIIAPAQREILASELHVNSSSYI